MSLDSLTHDHDQMNEISRLLQSIHESAKRIDGKCDALDIPKNDIARRQVARYMADSAVRFNGTYDADNLSLQACIGALEEKRRQILIHELTLQSPVGRAQTLDEQKFHDAKSAANSDVGALVDHLVQLDNLGNDKVES